MSGSGAKRERKERRAEGLDKWQAKEKEELEKKKKNKLRFWIVAPIVLVVLIFIILINTSLPYTQLAAVRVGDVTFSAGDFNYYYNTAYGNFQEMYGDMVSQLINAEVPLDQQMFSEEQTWEEYFTEVALGMIKETVALCKAAEAAGYTLSQEELDEIDNEIYNMSAYYPYYGYKSEDEYFAYMYGRGVNTEVLRKNIEMVVLASSYGNYVKDNAEFSDAEILGEYEENQNTYDKVAYRYFYVSSSADLEEESGSDAAMRAAKEIADSFAEYADTEEKFIEKAYEYASDDEKADYEFSSGTMRRYTLAGLNSSYSDWLTDSSRQYGDVAVIESYSGYGVLFYVGYDDGHYNTRNARHVLVTIGEDAEDAEEGSARSEAWELAEGYIQEWEEGGATEDAFATIAMDHSYDTETYKNGGLIDRISKGQLAKEFEDWIFDEARKNGDVDIVEAVDGLHVVFYIGEDGEYWSLAALSKLQSGYYETWKTELLEGYSTTTALGMKFTMK